MSYLNISRSLFYKLAKRNEFTLFKLGGRASGVMRADLDTWLAKSRGLTCI